MNKITDSKSVSSLVKDGMSVMIGGFMSCGAPEGLIDEIVANKTKDLTIICNDTGTIDRGIGKLVVAGCVRKIIATHIGTNPETGKLMTEGKIDVELIPQGTLVERIRCGGAGLGGFLTPTGVGTVVQDGKEVKIIDGKEYLLELPIRADITLIRGSVVDKSGNVVYYGTTRNFSPIMATAADTVVVEAESLVDIGNISPELVMTPAPLVDWIAKGDEVW